MRPPVLLLIAASVAAPNARALDVEQADTMNRYPSYNGAVAQGPGAAGPRSGSPGFGGWSGGDENRVAFAAPRAAAAAERAPAPSHLPQKLPKIAPRLDVNFDNAEALAPMAQRPAAARPKPGAPAAAAPPPAPQRPNGEPAMPVSPPPKRSSLGMSLSRRNNNPGNLMYAQWETQYGAVRGAGNRFGTFAKFPSVEAGFRALRHLLLSARFRDLTLAQAMNKHAPYVAGSGNDPQLYAKIVARDVRVSQSTRVRDLDDEQMNRLLLSIQQVEGWH